MKKCFIGQAICLTQRLVLFIIILVCQWSINANAFPTHANDSLTDLDDYLLFQILGPDSSMKDVLNIRKRRSWCGKLQCTMTSSPFGLDFIKLAANDNDAKPSALSGKELIDASKGRFNSSSGSRDIDYTDVKPFEFSSIQEAREGCEYAHEESGIEIRINAVPYLNPNYDGRSSPVLLVIFQLSDINYVRKIAGGSDGVWALFDHPMDKTILEAVRINIQSGEQISYTFDRIAGTRYLMIVAGYRDYDPSKSIKLYNIPTKQYWYSRECVATKLEVQLEVDHRLLR